MVSGFWKHVDDHSDVGAEKWWELWEKSDGNH